MGARAGIVVLALAVASYSSLVSAQPLPEGIAETSAAAHQPAPLLPSVSVLQLKDWVIASGDHGELPFIVIDKIEAAVFAFNAAGGFVGAAPALLGVAIGDDSTPGIEARELSAIGPKERTTPAGRFAARIGPALGSNQNVLWVDYATSVAMHPVIQTGDERRFERLQSQSPDDNRITYGCINVSDAYYRHVVRPLFIQQTGIVYILPDTKPVDEVFPGFSLVAARSEPMQSSVSDAR